MKRLRFSVLAMLALFFVQCTGDDFNTEPIDYGDYDIDRTDGDVDEALGELSDESEATEMEEATEAEPWAGVLVDVGDDGRTLSFSLNESPLVKLGGAVGHPFFLHSSEGALDFGELTEKSEQAGGVVLHYRLEDGREATVTLAYGDHAAMRVSIEVAEKRANEEIGIRFEVEEREGFYGLMERVVQGNQSDSWQPEMTEGFDLRGQEVNLYVMPTISIYSPFFVSSKSWGAYFESDWPGDYSFGVENPKLVEVVYEGEAISFQLIADETPADVTKRYAKIIGTTIMPPKWAFGPWRWRDEVWDLPAFYDGTPYEGKYNSMIVEDILMMEALGIPCSLYWVDRPWCPGDFGYDDLAWDEARLPEPVEMIQWLEAKQIKFQLWIAPWASGPTMLPEAEAEGYIVENSVPGVGGTALLDLTNPEAVAWWQDAIIERINDGIAGFKLDRSEERTPDGLFFQGTYYDGTSYREGHNRYVYEYAKAVHGAFERAGTEEFVVMPRAAWRGSQRHAIFWGGDTHPSEWGLRSAIIALQRAAVMNFPIWGSDTCGYGMSERETCARWLAFSAFTPLMEVGPTGDYSLWSLPPEETGGSVGSGGYSYEPEYDAELLAIWHFYANLHNDISDYLQSYAQKSHETGELIVRPMIFQYPENEAYLDLWSQYLLGEDILVAPVWRNGQERMDVMIPQGTWFDAWTGEAVQPNQVVSVETPKHKIPIFLRADGAVQLGDLNERWRQALEATATPPDLGALSETVE